VRSIARFSGGLAFLLAAGSTITLAGAAVAQQDQRRFNEREWRLVGGVAPAMESPVLLPLLLAATDSAVYVFDYGDHAVKAFKFEGTLLWTVGRAGRGPGEFQNPTDLQMDAGGRIWVTDPSNLRITIVTGDGQVEQLIRPEQPVARVMPLNGGSRFWGLSQTIGSFGYRFDSSGSVEGALPPPSILQDRHPLEYESLAAASSHARRVVVGFLYADYLLFTAQQGPDWSLVRGIEKLDFPGVLQWTQSGLPVTRIHPDAREATLSVTVDSSKVYVLFGGSSDERGRIVDVYSLVDGTYLESYLLPESVIRISKIRNGLVGLVRDPVPAIRVWRWSAKPIRQ